MWDKSRLDPDKDWELFDGIEEVSYYRFDPATDTYGTAVTLNVLCRELGANLVTLANGETTAVDLVFHVRRSELENSNVMPRRFDKIVREENRGIDGDEENATYIVQNVRWSTFGTRYRLECNRQVT